MQRLQWVVVLFTVWLGLTGSFHIQEIAAGLIVSTVLVWLVVPRSAGESRPWHILGALAYIPTFMKNLVLANVDVARRVLDPRLPINPGIVRIETDLETPYKRLILANSITLTPGTITLELNGRDMYIHWLDIQEQDPQQAAEKIKGDLERAIARF